MKKRIYALFLLVLLSLSFGLVFNKTKTSKAVEDTNYSNLKSLLTDYYGDGTYKKDTTIYVDMEKITEELGTYFHAKATDLVRTTYYTKDALWMSRGSDSGNTNYSYYGTAEGNTGVTNAIAATPLVAPTSASVALKGENQNSMEEYYVTLNDFIEGTHTSAHTNNETLDLSSGWKLSDGVYKNTNSDVFDAFRLFTAPLWLGKTAQNANYLTYKQATIEVVDSKLVMKLWVSSTNSGQLTETETKVVGNDTYHVFSQAVITKRLSENLQDYFEVYKEDVQAGLGTDFEGYSPETHPELFSSDQFTSNNGTNYFKFEEYPCPTYATQVCKGTEKNPHGLWFKDNNGQNAFAMQSKYEDLRLAQEEDGNIALKVTKGNGTLTRIGLDVDESVLNPGKYRATIRVKSETAETTGPGKILFKLNDNHNLFADGNVTDGFYFLGKSSDASSKKYTAYPYDEYTTLTVDFEIKGESVTNDVCAVLVVYSPASGSLLFDDFKIYKADYCGTDFDCYNPIDNPSLFVAVGSTLSAGWKTYNGTKVFATPKGYQASAPALDPDDPNNTVLRVEGSKDKSRLPLYPNQTIKAAGTYIAKIKVRLGTEKATNIGKIYFEFNKMASYNADGKLPIEPVYFSESDDTISILSTSEWTTLEVVFTITEDMSLILENEGNAISIVLNVTTNNTTLGLSHKENHILIDDFEIYRYNFE